MMREGKKERANGIGGEGRKGEERKDIGVQRLSEKRRNIEEKMKLNRGKSAGTKKRRKE